MEIKPILFCPSTMLGQFYFIKIQMGVRNLACEIRIRNKHFMVDSSKVKLTESAFNIVSINLTNTISSGDWKDF